MILPAAFIFALAAPAQEADHSDDPAPAERSDVIHGKPVPKPKRPRPTAPTPVARGPVEIPVDIGVGPVALFPNPVPGQQLLYGGVQLQLAAIIDKDLIDANRGRIPPGLRGAARNIGEVKYRPWFLALVPEEVVISPQFTGVANTGMYGAVWRPFGLGLDLYDGPVDISVNGAVDFAYLFIHSAALGGGSFGAESYTHFLRPGLNVSLTAEWPIAKALVLTGGWSSDLFVPQQYGAPPWEVSLDDSLWHLGGPFLMLHVRVPYEVNL